MLRGLACGARGTAIGEVVFNTGMTGYQEVMTDPSYAGQLVTFTYPELGNTGVNAQDQEANRPHVKGLITRRLAPVASNWRATEDLERWLQRHGVVGIRDVDTRALVRHLREGGSINGAISSEGLSPPVLLERVRAGVRERLGGYLQHPLYSGGLEDCVVAPGLGTRSGILGALALARQLVR
jgi:carbamoyl-phosphate synthase small subunit